MTIATAQRIRPNTPSPARELSLLGAIRSEWIKASSLRSIRWSILVSIALGVGMSLIMGFAIRDLIPEASESGTEFIMAVTSFPASFLVLVFGVLGVFMFSSEYSSGMILSTLTAVPRRGMLLVAKAVVLTVISAVVAAFIVAAGVAIAVILVPESASHVFTAVTLSSLAGTVVFLVAITLFAFAIAGILRSTAGAITAVVAVVFLAPTVLQILGQVTDWSWVPHVSNYLPTALGSTLGAGVDAELTSASVQMTDGVAETATIRVPGYWEAMWSLALWVVIPMVVAVKLFFDRDAK